MKKDVKPLNGVGPGLGLSAKQLIVAKQMKKARKSKQRLPSGLQISCSAE